MVIVYIKPNQFAKNVDNDGNIFDFQFEKNEKADGVVEIIDVYLENGFTKVELEDVYFDCVKTDFNEDLTFSVEKYNARKQKEKDNKRIAEIKPRLEQLSQDIIQSLAGAEFEDLAERQKEFKTLHNELRVLLGKEPRKYMEV